MLVLKWRSHARIEAHQQFGQYRLPRNSAWAISELGASAIVEMALSDFILRHQSEFIPIDEVT